MTEDERNLDLMVAELESENRLMSTQNKQLEQELEAALYENAKFRIALERIMAVTKLAYEKQNTKPKENV
jgi:hypothetical protein|tara:strand:+ start:817 stop:1026 length:210 start_codon:yes stop_codon:yes gene_type:complete